MVWDKKVFFRKPNHIVLQKHLPCIWTRNSVLIRLADSDSLSERDEHNESISSMNMILGFCDRARSNKFLTNFSDSPNHFETKSDDETEKNVELFASVATAFAR